VKPHIRLIRKVTIFTLSLGLLSLPIPSFSGIRKVKTFYAISVRNVATQNGQSSRLIIVVVQLGAVKIHVTAVEVLREKERQGETQFNTKTYSFLSFIRPLYANVLFLQVFFSISPCV
jgi:surface polysaccharide O-acyltransferase-like enzyme